MEEWGSEGNDANNLRVVKLKERESCCFQGDVKNGKMHVEFFVQGWKEARLEENHYLCLATIYNNTSVF